ncbi:MAG: nucleotidyltransferase domain-containing protein [Armatimonadota bacterium]
MKQKTAHLLALAEYYCTELSEHPILSEYWPKISLILKGSVARDNTDRYSDIDLVFFCDKEILYEIASKYHELGLTNRDDGVFMPLPEWVGHYNFEALDKLEEYFSKPDYAQAWEYQNVITLYDPGDQFRKLLDRLSSNLLSDPLPAIKQEYLNLMLTADWLMHPLMRGDLVASSLHCAKIVQSLCRISYLLDARPYPHDKWLFEYIGTTRFGKSNKRAISEYVGCISETPRKHLDLSSYPQFSGAMLLIGKVGEFIKKHYGKQPWIDEWYLYV